MIYVWGPLARLYLTGIAIMGFLLALGDVLDTYDAYWKFTAPLTVVYAAVIWIFALAPPKGQPKPQPVWPLGLDVIIAKTFMTGVLLLCTLGVVALAYDLYKLTVDNWHYVVVAFGLLAVVFIWAFLAGEFNDKKVAKHDARRRKRQARFAANEARSGPRGRVSIMQGKVWAWWVVAPAFLAAFAGVLADIVTGTLFYWPLTVPSYVVVSMLNWRGTSDWATRAWRKKELARLDAEAAEAESRPLPPEQPSIVASDEALVDEPIVAMMRQHNVGGFIWELLRLIFVRGLATVALALLYMVALQVAIDVGMWGKGYWYIYGPVFVGIAWFVWAVYREGPADDPTTAVTSVGDPLVR